MSLRLNVLSIKKKKHTIILYNYYYVHSYTFKCLHVEKGKGLYSLSEIDFMCVLTLAFILAKVRQYLNHIAHVRPLVYLHLRIFVVCLELVSIYTFLFC